MSPSGRKRSSVALSETSRDQHLHLNTLRDAHRVAGADRRTLVGPACRTHLRCLDVASIRALRTAGHEDQGRNEVEIREDASRLQMG
jgi:hypothetical protein